jgi:uncharacterized protein YoxC
MMNKIRKKQVWLIALLLTVALVPVARADLGDIVSVLTNITSTIKNGIGKALSGMSTIQTKEQQLQQDILFPVSVINQTKASVARIRSQFGGLAQQIHSLSTSSATLANSQQLESLFRGQQISGFGQMGGAYSNVFQPLPQVNAASPATRNLMDVDDAFASGALKTTVISDQASEQMLSVADQIEQQSAAAAPGSAPMLSAQALATNLQSQAFLQKMLAAELREEAARLAHTNMLIKESSASTNDLTNGMQQVVTK